LKIISHRGFWISEHEKNTVAAFTRSLECGYGIETDVRDCNGKLVISHDLPSQVTYLFDEFLATYCKFSKMKNSSLYIAINIKSDGLQDKVKKLLDKYKIQHYFVFDMSVPDTINYIKQGVVVFSRVSELENNNTLNLMTNGIWLDQFYGDWYKAEIIKELVDSYNQVCVVSPELHNRSKDKCWEMLLKLPENIRSRIMLCTDLPDKAKEFFYEK
jgi:glycerophosphoryl diester phosphodiesterase